jgi:Tfp pilus assembly protein PilF
MVGVWQSRTQHPGPARQAFLNAIAADPNYIAPRLALAHLDVETGNLDEARQMLQTILSRQPKNAPALLASGILEERSGHESVARERFRAVMDTEPGNVEALTHFAFMLAQENADEALRYAQMAVELAPTYAEAQDTLGWVYYRKGLSGDALLHFKTAVSEQPTAVRRYHLALAYAKLGEKQLAQENQNAALQMDPELKVTEPLQGSSR